MKKHTLIAALSVEERMKKALEIVGNRKMDIIDGKNIDWTAGYINRLSSSECLIINFDRNVICENILHCFSLLNVTNIEIILLVEGDISSLPLAFLKKMNIIELYPNNIITVIDSFDKTLKRLEIMNLSTNNSEEIDFNNTFLLRLSDMRSELLNHHKIN